MRWLKVLVILLCGGAAGYWMFSSTWAYYRPEGSGPLRISFWGPYEEYQMWRRMLADFQAAHPEISVRAEYRPGGQYEASIQRQMVAGDAPDVVLYQDEPFPRIVSNRKFRDLTPLIERDRAELGLATDGSLKAALDEQYWPVAVDYFGREIDGDWRQFGMPIWGGCNLIYYNRPSFQRCAIEVAEHDGPEPILVRPGGNERFENTWVLDDNRWTLTDFVKVTRRLTLVDEANNRVEQYGFYLGWPLYWLPFQQTMGARVVNETRDKTTFYGPEMEAALQLYYDLLWKHQVMPTSAGLGSLNADTGFYTRRIAMVNTGPWGMPFMNASGLDYDVLHMPRNDITETNRGERATRITFDALAISTDSKQVEKAWTLVKFLVQPEQQRTVAEVQRAIPAMRPPQRMLDRVLATGAASESDRSHPAIHFMMLNEDVAVAKFVAAAEEYAMIQPVNEHWGLLTGAWMSAMGGMNILNPERRLNPIDAIGRFYANQGDGARLKEEVPPADPEAVQPYIEAYERTEMGSSR